MIVRRIIPALCLFLLLGSGIGCDSSGPPQFDLVERFAIADTAAERSVLDLGTPEARDRLVSGWDHDEAAGQITYVWGVGDQSELRWYLSRPVNTFLFLRGWPLDESDATQMVTILVNGRRAGSIEMARRLSGYAVKVSRTSFVVGWNRIVLQYSFHRDSASTGKRPVAAAWDFIELRHRSSGYEEPHVAKIKDTPALVLPPGSQVDYFLPLPADARLEIDRAVWADDTAANPEQIAFEVELQGEGEAARILPAPQRLENGALRLPLDAAPGTPTRVSLRLPSDPDSRPLTLVRPRLRSDGPIGVPSLVPDERKAPSDSARPNVIVYLVDTLRADHLGCYGYARGTSPRLDRFAADAVLFRRTVAQSSWTRASVASIFTGLRPQRHGANRREDALSDDATTLAELLHAHGYETAGIVANGNVAPELGFGQGFDSYEMLHHDDQTPVPSAVVTEHAVSFLKARRDNRPLFLYVHTVDPHSPYDPPQPYRDRFAPGVTDPTIGSIAMLRELEQFKIVPTHDETLRRQLIGLYDADIAANDASFGDFVDRLSALGLYEDSLLVFVSDHGEEFYDHGSWEHGATLYDEQILVPLLIKFPGRRMAGRRADIVANQVDLLPTILASAGATIPDGIDGRSLLPYLAGEIDDRGPAISYVKLDGIEAESVLLDNGKLIHNIADNHVVPRQATELYDLAVDPGERTNVALDRPVQAGYLLTLLRAFALKGEPIFSAPSIELPEHVREQLRALGYSP